MGWRKRCPFSEMLIVGAIPPWAQGTPHTDNNPGCIVTAKL